MAANAMRGQVDFQAGGETYQLVLDVNAWCLIQTALDSGPMQVVEAFEGQPDNMIIARALLWAALQRNHPGTINEAGDILSDGGLIDTRRALADCISASFGVGSEGREKVNPPAKKKPLGTG